MFTLQQWLNPVVGSGLAWLSKDSFPQTDGALEMVGLHRPVKIFRDRLGIPHLRAENIHDVIFAQGYVHAQDRLWQMDFSRRLVSGRLAEVAGSAVVSLDRAMRILGLRGIAVREFDLLDPETQALLEAYASGVNARIQQRKLPLEFFLLGYRPEPWTPVDSLSWPKMIAWGLSGNWESELLRAALIDRVGVDQAGELELENLQPWPDQLSTILHARKECPPPETDFLHLPTWKDGLGSNSWVISGRRTASGMPLLANDMHLPLTTPALWYENHLTAGEFDATGVSLPGVPFITQGHNGRVAWGFTAGFADVQDLYVEHIRRDDSGKVYVEEPGGWVEAQVRREEIRVRGGKAVSAEVMVTTHGPLINDLLEKKDFDQPLALSWTAFQPDLTSRAMIRLNLARSCIDVREALREWSSPAVNVVYADREGNIGYSLAGSIPVRSRGDGRVPVPGWTGEYRWTGMIPFDELPHLYNPPQGFIVTANNRVTGADYQHTLGCDYVIADRARRITELILAEPRMDVETARVMQFDQVSHTGRRMAGILAGVIANDKHLDQVLNLLRGWDGSLTADSPAAAVHEVFMRVAVPLLLRGVLGDLTERYAGKGPSPILAEGSVWGFRSWEWLQQTLASAGSHWFDLGEGETRQDILIKALSAAVDYLEKECGRDISSWSWGKLHRVTFAHPLGRIRALQPYLSRGPFPAGGDGTTIWSNYAVIEGSGEGVVAPPFRFIADLADLDHSLGLLSPGQSGQPGSPHYDDQVCAWFEGGYHIMLFRWDEIEREAAHCLELIPLETA